MELAAGVPCLEWKFHQPIKGKDPAMKKLTVAQAARELNALASTRLTTGAQDAFLRTRIEQFTGAVEEAITDLQKQVAQLQAQQAPSSDRPPR